MDAELKTKWVAALRSGKFQQGDRALRANDRYCCLGVLAEVKGCQWGKNIHGEATPVFGSEGVGRHEDSPCYLDESFSGLLYATQCALADLNDSGKPFPAIADWIEENIPVVSLPQDERG
jgi:hypothetical protein